MAPQITTESIDRFPWMICSAKLVHRPRSTPRRYHAQYIENKACSNALYLVQSTILLQLEMKPQKINDLRTCIPAYRANSEPLWNAEGLLKIHEIETVEYIFHDRDPAVHDVPISPCLGNRRLIEWGYANFSTGDGMMGRYTARGSTLIFISGLDPFASVPGNVTYVKLYF